MEPVLEVKVTTNNKDLDRLDTYFKLCACIELKGNLSQMSI